MAIRLRYETLDDIPPTEQILTFLEHDYVVFELPHDLPYRDFFGQLSPNLADCTIFLSGTSDGYDWITIMKVLSREIILAHTDEILAAIRLFRATASELMARLAEHLQVPLKAFWEEPFQLWFQRYGVPLERSRGTFDEWRYMFHGSECRFVHTATGQDVDVRLGLVNEFGTLDAHFLERFIHTTPMCEQLIPLFSDYHDSAQIIRVLAEINALVVVTNHQHFLGLTIEREGLTIRDLGDEPMAR